ncbi:glycerol-3-phosphate responsive antiterminator [Thermoanaerobacterium sp. CMT5567-10]|uniref:glycerol-3-phosphate responsive antiterminator n=1 Tax=Thermoanaerobacterium sp. CMT5567-10 TaxID=3061989 RepID=UPI0026DF6602|nr:glycerol-3-phosphate responsive antiterminator [Thermoanaerobacterium sp. CMT5567-10]WKV08135.1 glycerol-3-phosphate responsive antiterminator [Thermoanaerobacterium sp. CMT5567-10]
MDNYIIEKITGFPIIAAVRNVDDLSDVYTSNCEVIFLLTSNILLLKDTIGDIKKHNKTVFVHFDLVEGLGKDYKAVEYLKEIVKPDGIISTRNNILIYAKELGMPCIERIFLLDTQALKTGLNSIKQIEPTAIEVMPGVAHNVTRELAMEIYHPIIAGGLVKTKEDVINALSSGAVAVSTSEKSLWFID